MVSQAYNIENFMMRYEESLEENNFQDLKFHNVTKSYKNLVALKNVSLSVRRGDIFGYIGPNGAGKTTTLKIIVGLIKDYSGEYLINSAVVSDTKSDLSKLIGYHPQDVGFQSWRTVNSALYTFGRLSGISKSELEERILFTLQFVGLQDFREIKIKYLSGGMIQKLRLAQALLNFPKLLILDEPLSGLDPTSRFQIKSLIKALAQKEITILFSSHILNDVEDIANKIGIINQGNIMKIGTPSQLQEDFQLGNIIEMIYTEDSHKCLELDVIKEVEKIENYSNTMQLIHLRADVNADEVSHTILKKIIQQKCRIRSYRFVKPSLEKVYLHYLNGEVK
jgi:ABC-2 type transport system ATP-binding protein